MVGSLVKQQNLGKARKHNGIGHAPVLLTAPEAEEGGSGEASLGNLARPGLKQIKLKSVVDVTQHSLGSTPAVGREGEKKRGKERGTS